MTMIDIGALTTQADVCLQKILMDFGMAATREIAKEMTSLDANLQAAREHIVVVMHRYKSLQAKEFSETDMELLEAICAKTATNRERYLSELKKFKDAGGKTYGDISRDYPGLFLAHLPTMPLYWDVDKQLLRPAWKNCQDTALCHPLTIPKAFSPATVAE